jgi:hypothetical protein
VSHRQIKAKMRATAGQKQTALEKRPRPSFLLALVAMIVTCGQSPALEQPDPKQYFTVSPAVRAAGVAPAQRFAFLVGQWRVEQTFPLNQEAQQPDLREDWCVLPDGSMLGRSYREGDSDLRNVIEIRIVLEHGRYFHTLRGPSFTSGHMLRMPVVQVSPEGFASVSPTDHVPARTNYDRLKDGSIVASIYAIGDRDVTVYRMTSISRRLTDPTH